MVAGAVGASYTLDEIHRFPKDIAKLKYFILPSSAHILRSGTEKKCGRCFNMPTTGPFSYNQHFESFLIS